MQKTSTLYWHATTPDLKPTWLDGCADVQSAGAYWWVGDAMIVPDWSAVEWIDAAPGWKVSRPVDDIDLTRYLRDRRWHVPIEVVDTRGRTWFIPAILAPDGVPAVAQVRRLVDGEWVREFVDDSQSAAVEACQAFRSGAEMDLDQQCNALTAILACAYHLDPTTIGVLGMVDDVLVVHGLRAAAGLSEEG